MLFIYTDENISVDIEPSDSDSEEKTDNEEGGENVTEDNVVNEEIVNEEVVEEENNNVDEIEHSDENLECLDEIMMKKWLI